MMAGILTVFAAGFATVFYWPHSSGFAVGFTVGLLAAWDVWRVLPVRH